MRIAVVAVVVVVVAVVDDAVANASEGPKAPKRYAIEKCRDTGWWNEEVELLARGKEGDSLNEAS